MQIAALPVDWRQYAGAYLCYFRRLSTASLRAPSGGLIISGQSIARVVYNTLVLPELSSCRLGAHFPALHHAEEALNEALFSANR